VLTTQNYSACATFLRLLLSMFSHMCFHFFQNETPKNVERSPPRWPSSLPSASPLRLRHLGSLVIARSAEVGKNLAEEEDNNPLG
jgi:hypothetical protein